MTAQLSQFGMGARFVPAETLTETHLGPLKHLVGEWESVTLKTTDATGAEQITPSGWNVISVPAEGGFAFEVIPYVEHLRFSTVAVNAGNRGPILNGSQEDQQIFGLFYEQHIKSACDTDFCKKRGFPKGTAIHAETGMFLFIRNFNGGFEIARLSTVPHGNAVLALGTHSDQVPPGTNFFQSISALATNPDGSPIDKKFGYNDPIEEAQFALFNQVDPNTFLKSTLESIVGKGSIAGMTTLQMSTDHPEAKGGILNIPFIQSNVTATSMEATFWLETISGGSEAELLQYSQTINLVFPPGGTTTPIKWPHITISTLKRLPKPSMLAKVFGASQGAPQL